MTTLTSEDYPQLIEPDKPVRTLAVGAVLMVYNWRQSSDRYRKVSRFVETLLDHTNVPVASVDIRAPLQGWTRFAPAEKWMAAHDLTKHVAAPQSGEAKHASGATGEGSGSSVPPAAQRAMPAQLSRDDRISLFKDFVEYQKNFAGE